MKLRRELVRIVDLRFFQDDANGEYGLAHHDTINRNEVSFNAFWRGRGLFHDVWEHAHEFDKYFCGKYALNMGGEMVASGATWYYLDRMNCFDRGNFNSPEDQIINLTFYSVKETIEGNSTQFGDMLECAVPNQKPCDDSGIENIVEEYAAKVRKCIPMIEEPKDLELGVEPYSAGKEYKKSCTAEKIANLHRYGYKMAQKLVPYNYHNHSVLSKFMSFWQQFCERHSAEEMQYYYSGLVFKIYRDSEKNISWHAEFTQRPSCDLPEEMIYDSRTIDK